MNFKNIALVLCFLPMFAWGADRDSGVARVGMTRSNTNAGGRMVSVSGMATKSASVAPVVNQRAGAAVATTGADVDQNDVKQDVVAVESGTCRDAFCLLDETEGSRCACSDNISGSKKLIQEIQKIQSEADELYTTGVERERFGAKARLVFGESDTAKKSSLRSGVDFSAWLNVADEDEGDLAEDVDIGKKLYEMASESCAAELEKCGAKAKAEELLYSRLIVADCKSFDSYLSDQKRDAESNKKTAEAAVRAVRSEMLNTTNKYNRGECLLVYRSCIADKGGCGVNFENCLDEGLLSRRANACEDVLDQCMYVRNDVIKDWQDESVAVLKDAAKYADKNQRATCLAKIQNCLEEGCSTSTNSACLTDVRVAAGICPIITECNEKIPGIQTVINDKLAYLQTKFCENDLDACLKDKCGTDFTKPECVGKKASEIATLCPQSMFPSCKNAAQYDVLVSSAMLHMDYQLLTGCVNQYAEKLTAVCGSDMTCLSVDDMLPVVNGWVDLQLSDVGQSYITETKAKAKTAVDNFFTEFEKDLTLSACQDVISGSSTRVAGRRGARATVNSAAKMIAYSNAENRALRELASRMDELKIREETNKARKYCLETYKKEQKPDEKNYSYIRSVTYEPDLHNCHVCRVQQVCEVGGEKKSQGIAKGVIGGMSSGGSIGVVGGPWGAAIGAVAGGVIGGVLGANSSDEEEYCQELESCEDINVSGASLDDEDTKSNAINKLSVANINTPVVNGGNTSHGISSGISISNVSSTSTAAISATAALQ